MIFKSKKAFEEAVRLEVEKRYSSEKHMLIFEVEIGDMTKEQVEEYTEKIWAKLKDKLGHENFIVVPTNNGWGHINISYVS